jgi:hypothetical protein
MSNLRRLRRTQTPGREPPVLIVRPHKQEGFTCESTSQFLSKAFKRGIADYVCYESRTPDMARNTGINEFLHNPMHRKKTHLFFLDDDSTPWNDFVIERLLGLDKPVVAGVTPIFRKRQAIDFKKIRMIRMGIIQNEPIIMDLHWSAIIKNEEGKLENIGIDELPGTLFKAYRTGGTSILVSREVLEKLKSPYQKFEFDESNTKLLRSEDFYFSDKIREAGFDIWIDPTSVCHHFHVLDILDLFSAIIQAKQKGFEEAKSKHKVVV